MKKFLFVIILLIVLGGTVFFLGWGQLTVPPGSYGVMRTKTHGLESRTIQDGEFRWFWYKLIPTNAVTSVFTINPVKRAIKSSGNLPSGNVYATLAGLEADFSWEISGEINFSLKPEYLPEFTDRESINDDAALREAEENLAIRIENLVLKQLKNYADNNQLESFVLASSLPALNNEIQRSFPEIENLSCTIQLVRFPDYALYQSVKALYQEYLSWQNNVLSQDLVREAERRINSRIRLDELAQYGELLTRYPILVEYLTIERNLRNE
ncbi:MAG: hypothetical protein LBH42_05130 [Treponema sp.]|jgi:hypothetical protein|nr:hypothetical protein [Treponema sp.]